MWTTAKLQNIQVPEDKTKVTMTDPETRGLVYEVRRAGRSFYLRYTFEGRQRTIPLGPFPTLSIKDARKKAEELKRKVLMGSDPLGEKHQKTHSPTIREFFNTVYLPYSKNQHRDPYGNQSLFMRHLEPRFGSKRMNEISKLMIRTWINDLLAKGYSASFINRILVLMGNLYTIANDLDVKVYPYDQNSVLSCSGLFRSIPPTCRLRRCRDWLWLLRKVGTCGSSISSAFF